MVRTRFGTGRWLAHNKNVNDPPSFYCVHVRTYYFRFSIRNVQDFPTKIIKAKIFSLIKFLFSSTVITLCAAIYNEKFLHNRKC